MARNVCVEKVSRSIWKLTAGIIFCLSALTFCFTVYSCSNKMSAFDEEKGSPLAGSEFMFSEKSVRSGKRQLTLTA